MQRQVSFYHSARAERTPFFDVYVQVKYLDLETTGHNQSVKRRKHRRLVEEQAERYGRAWAERSPFHLVLSATFTNEDGLQNLSVVSDVADSRAEEAGVTDGNNEPAGAGWWLFGAGFLALSACAIMAGKRPDNSDADN